MEQKKMMMPTLQGELKRKVLYFSICSRLFIFLLSFIANVVLPDHNANVFTYPQPAFNRSTGDHWVNETLGGLVRWDAQYFIHISLYGYTYENTLPFFPLFPYMSRMLAIVLDTLMGPTLNHLSTIIISASLINLFFFCKAATTLFDLSCIILKDVKLAYISSLFFCINPASIFFTAPYSESCFAFFTFSGMLFCVQNENGLLSSFAFGISTCVRSNGLINFGFIVHKNVKTIFSSVNSKKNFFQVLYAISVQLTLLFIYAAICFAPFFMYQLYLYSKFCHGKLLEVMDSSVWEFGNANEYLMPGDKFPPWCNYTIPLSYSYVQSKYWNVGFLKYYKLKQIPNFLLAIPVFIVVLINGYSFMRENKYYVLSLGFTKAEFVHFKGRQLKAEFFVFVAHTVCLCVFCALFVHVQVTTRLVASSCPCLYWFVAFMFSVNSTSNNIQSRLRSVRKSDKYSLVESSENMNSYWKTIILTEKPMDLRSYIVKVYFCSYLVLGTILFSNFLPWT